MTTTMKLFPALALLLTFAAPRWDRTALAQETPVLEEPGAVDADDATAVGEPLGDEPLGVDSAVTAEAPPAPIDATPAVDADPDGNAGAGDAIDGVVETVDASAEAQQVSAGILKPIYTLAERFSFPAFHWVAFAVMVAGVVSFALQLVLGKLVVLTRLSFSVTEILSDVLGLAVSVIGLVLTTQAAAENSTFTTSAFAVLSATAAGAFAGFVFYLWGQRQELLAVEGRRAAAKRNQPAPPTAPRG